MLGFIKPQHQALSVQLSPRRAFTSLIALQSLWHWVWSAPVLQGLNHNLAQWVNRSMLGRLLQTALRRLALPNVVFQPVWTLLLAHKVFWRRIMLIKLAVTKL